MRSQSYQGWQVTGYISNLTRSQKMSVKFSNTSTAVAEIVDEVALTAMNLLIALSVPLFMLTSM